ncbi:MAG TPA: cupin domain-containing protein [Candidatus Limnocylindria bacterium]|nr:cupin domain-containing protein [Candidatus Limnocylindria bacterium]
MHLVSHVDWSFSDAPPEMAGSASGFARKMLVGRETGATHSELTVCRLQPRGEVGRHMHSFEEASYVLAGQPVLELGERRLVLEAGDFALAPIGMAHGWSNPGGEEARWLTISTPMRTTADEGRADTFAVEPLAVAGEPARPAFGHPSNRWVGHYAGTPPQAEALALPDPARGRRPAGMDTALLAYSGISVKMLIDRTFGAELLTMFTVDYEPNGAAQVHDHPFEETYFFLDGEIEAVLDGKEYTIRAGDVVFAGVGSTHGFFNTGSGRVRWIETQAPQPPARHAYRWVDVWKRFEKGAENA